MILFSLVIFFILISNSATKKCEGINDLDITAGSYLSNGNITFEGKIYEPSEYSIDRGLVKACVCKKGVCFVKCCPFGYGYEPRKQKCLETADSFNPEVRDEYTRTVEQNSTDFLHFNFGKPTCKQGEVRTRVKRVYLNDVELRTDGKLYIEVPNNIPPWISREPRQYCVDDFIIEDSIGTKRTSFDALACFARDKQKNNYVISSTCMLVSCVFILATVAVYAWLPELRNLHGRVLMAYLLCLFVAFVCLATMQLMLKYHRIGVNLCVGLTIIIYFSLLAAFFWLNVMCFDIWWTFSGKRGITTEKMSVRAKFCAYSVYAFSIPLAFTVLLVCLEFSGLPPHPLLPLLSQGCFLVGKSKLLYLYGPIVILWFSNLVFFVLTALKIAQLNKQTSVLKRSDSAKHVGHNKDQQRLFLYIKLFIIMGLNWLLEVISAIYPDAEIFRFVDAYNVLIGVIVFIVFVCKRKIFKLIRERFYGDISKSSQMRSTGRTTREGTTLTSRNR